MPLRTDYTNDILDTSKNTERKYNIKNSNGTIVEENVTFEDVTEYSQEGSRFGATDINVTNEAVNNINVYVGEDKKLHFVNGDGADSVLPFSSAEIIEEYYTTPWVGGINSIATFPNYTTTGIVTVANERASKAILIFDAGMVYYNHTSYWRVKVNDVIVAEAKELPKSSGGSPSGVQYRPFKTFVIDVKQGDVIKMESSDSNGGTINERLIYHAMILA